MAALPDGVGVGLVFAPVVGVHVEVAAPEPEAAVGVVAGVPLDDELEPEAAVGVDEALDPDPLPVDWGVT